MAMRREWPEDWWAGVGGIGTGWKGGAYRIRLKSGSGAERVDAVGGRGRRLAAMERGNQRGTESLPASGGGGLAGRGVQRESRTEPH